MAELPGQVVQYYQSLGIQPNVPPPSINMSQMLIPQKPQIDPNVIIVMNHGKKIS